MFLKQDWRPTNSQPSPFIFNDFTCNSILLNPNDESQQIFFSMGFLLCQQWADYFLMTHCCDFMKKNFSHNPGLFI